MLVSVRVNSQISFNHTLMPVSVRVNSSDYDCWVIPSCQRVAEYCWVCSR